jgi:hypothetical protein
MSGGLFDELDALFSEASPLDSMQSTFVSLWAAGNQKNNPELGAAQMKP